MKNWKRLKTLKNFEKWSFWNPKMSFLSVFGFFQMSKKCRKHTIRFVFLYRVQKYIVASASTRDYKTGQITPLRPIDCNPKSRVVRMKKSVTNWWQSSINEIILLVRNTGDIFKLLINRRMCRVEQTFQNEWIGSFTKEQHKTR